MSTSDVRLHTVAALHKGGKERAHLALTHLHQESQKPGLYGGQSKRYTPFDEEDKDRPADVNERVQLRSQDVLTNLRHVLRPLWDTEATLDATNQEANADLVVDGEVLVMGAPATYLLFIQKQLDIVRTFIDKLPTLPVTDDWVYDKSVGYWVTSPVKTVSNRKRTVPLVLHPGTDRHPPQAQAVQEDVPVGAWETIKRSGALPVDVKARLLRRVVALQDAAKAARERANMTPVVELAPSSALLGFLLDDGGA